MHNSNSDTSKINERGFVAHCTGTCPSVIGYSKPVRTGAIQSFPNLYKREERRSLDPRETETASPDVEREREK